MERHFYQPSHERSSPQRSAWSYQDHDVFNGYDHARLALGDHQQPPEYRSSAGDPRNLWRSQASPMHHAGVFRPSTGQEGLSQVETTRKRKREYDSSGTVYSPITAMPPSSAVSRASIGKPIRAEAVISLLSDDEDDKSKLTTHLHQVAGRSQVLPNGQGNRHGNATMRPTSPHRQHSYLSQLHAARMSKELELFDQRELERQSGNTSRSPATLPKLRNELLGPTFRSDRTPPLTIVRKQPIKKEALPQSSSHRSVRRRTTVPLRLAKLADNAIISDFTTSFTRTNMRQATAKRTCGPFLQDDTEENELVDDHMPGVDNDNIVGGTPAAYSHDLQSRNGSSDWKKESSYSNEYSTAGTPSQEQEWAPAYSPDSSVEHQEAPCLSPDGERTTSQQQNFETMSVTGNSPRGAGKESMSEYARVVRKSPIKSTDTPGPGASFPMPIKAHHSTSRIPDIYLDNGASTVKEIEAPADSRMLPVATSKNGAHLALVSNDDNPTQQSVLMAMVAKARAANKVKAKAILSESSPMEIAHTVTPHSSTVTERTSPLSANKHTPIQNPAGSQRRQPDTNLNIDSEFTELQHARQESIIQQDDNEDVKRIRVEREKRVQEKKARNERYRAADEDSIEARAEVSFAESEIMLQRPVNSIESTLQPQGPFALNSTAGVRAVQSHRTSFATARNDTQINSADRKKFKKTFPTTRFEPFNNATNSNHSARVKPKRLHRRTLGQVTSSDLQLLQWADMRMTWEEISALHERYNGIHRARSTLTKRCRQVRQAILESRVPATLCEDVIANKPGAQEELNQILTQNTEPRERTQLQADVYNHPVRPSDQQNAVHTASANWLQSPTPSGRALQVPSDQSGPMRDSAPPIGMTRPTYGGKQPSWALLDSYVNSVRACEEDEPLVEDADTAALSRESTTDPQGFIHFAYQVQRRECAMKQQTEEGTSIGDAQWHDVDDPHESLEQANAAACGPVLLMQMGELPIVDAAGKYAIEKDQGEDGDAFCQYRSNRGVIQTRVRKRMRTFRDQIPARSKACWLPKTLYHIKLRETKSSTGNDLFEEKTISVQEKCIDEGTCADLAWSNAKAIEKFVEMTYEVKSSNLKLRDLDIAQTKQALSMELEGQDEGAMFSRRKETKDGLLEVWVEKGKLVGPRNL